MIDSKPTDINQGGHDSTGYKNSTNKNCNVNFRSLEFSKHKIYCKFSISFHIL